MRGKDYYNHEGYADPTAHSGTRRAAAYEAQQMKVKTLIQVLKFIIHESGFELVGRIELRDRNTGRLFR